MRKRILPLLLILLLCLPCTCAHALVVQIGDETIILDDAVLETSDSNEINIVGKDCTILENGVVLIHSQTPNAQWLYSQLENTNQSQLLLDITAALYLMNCMQNRDISSVQNITADSLEDFLCFFFDGNAELIYEGDDLCYFELSDEAYMKFSLDGNYITNASLHLSGIENAYDQVLCVDFELP